MFKRLFRLTSSGPNGQQNAAAEAANSFESPNIKSLAIDLLCSDHGARLQLTRDEAKIVVSYLQEKRFPPGKMVLAEGEQKNVDYLLVVIDGDVAVETIMVGQAEPMMITVLGAGSFLGELGVIDGGPRSTTCTAASELICGLLKGEALEALIDAHPKVAVKLMLLISKRLAERLRDNTEKLKVSVQLGKTMFQELLENN